MWLLMCHIAIIATATIPHCGCWFFSHIALQLGATRAPNWGSSNDTSQMRHVTHVNEACHIYEWGHPYVWHASFTCVVCLIYIPIESPCDMPHSYVWHASFLCVACLIYMCGMPHLHTNRVAVWHASFTSVTCLNHMCDMPQSHVWYASFTYQ